MESTKIVQNEQNRARNFIQPSGFHLGARRTSKFHWRSWSLFLAGGRASLRFPLRAWRPIHARPVAEHGRGEQWFGSFATDSIQQLGQSCIRAAVFKSRRFFFSDHV